MSKHDLSQMAVREFNQFVSSLRSSQAVNSGVGNDDPPPSLYFRQATGVEAVNLLLRKRPELELHRQLLIDSAKPKYSFDNDKWCTMLVSVGGERL